MYMNDLIEITDGANSMGKILRIDEEKDEWEYYPPEKGIYSDNYAVDSANWAVDPSWPTTANDSWIRFVNDYGAGIVQDADYNWICLIGSQKLYWGEDSRWHYGDYYQFGDTDYFTDRMGGVSINDYTFFSSEIGNWMVAGYYGLSKCDPPQEAYDLMAQEQTFESDQRRDKDIKAFQNIYGFTCYEENGDWYVDTTQGILKYDPFNKEWSGTVSVADLNSEGIWIYTDEEIMVFCVELNHGEFRYADGRDDDGNIKIYGVSCSGLPGSQYAEFTGIYNAAPDWPLFSDIDHPDRW